MLLQTRFEMHHREKDVNPDGAKVLPPTTPQRGGYFPVEEYDFYLFPESPEVNVGGIEYIWVRGRAGWEGSLDKGRNQRHLRSRKGTVEAYQMDGWEVVDTERGVEL